MLGPSTGITRKLSKNLAAAFENVVAAIGVVAVAVAVLL